MANHSQFLNAAAMTARGMGKTVHYEDMSDVTMTEALKFALDPTTQETARRIQFAYRNRLRPVQETAVWWVEHVVATAGAPLAKSHAVFMSAFVYHSFDVYVLLAIVLVSILGSWLWLVRYVCRASKSILPSKLKSN